MRCQAHWADCIACGAGSSILLKLFAIASRRVCESGHMSRKRDREEAELWPKEELSEPEEPGPSTEVGVTDVSDLGNQVGGKMGATWRRPTCSSP